MTNYEFGDVVLIHFPLSDPHRRKKRPALVILDIGDADAVLVPVTSVARTGRGDVSIRDWSQCGLLKASWARLAKVACLSKFDIERRLGSLSLADRHEVAGQWQSLYAPTGKTEAK